MPGPDQIVEAHIKPTDRNPKEHRRRQEQARGEQHQVRLEESLGRVPPLTNADIWVALLGVRALTWSQVVAVGRYYVRTSQLGHIAVSSLIKQTEAAPDLEHDPFLAHVCFGYGRYGQNEVGVPESTVARGIVEGAPELRLSLSDRGDYMRDLEIMESFRKSKLALPTDPKFSRMDEWRGKHQADFIRRVYEERVIPLLGDRELIIGK